MYVQLSEAVHRQNGRGIIRRRELDTVGRNGPVRKRVDHAAVPAVSDDVVASLDVVRRMDGCEGLERHDDSLVAGGDEECNARSRGNLEKFPWTYRRSGLMKVETGEMVNRHSLVRAGEQEGRRVVGRSGACHGRDLASCSSWDGR